MSTTIDSKVVEMRFDNSHFEKNVAHTMSTLDKLKEKLGFKGAVNGLEEVSASAKKVDLSHIGQAADTVGLRFNAMYTIADQALRNITNSAMQAGKNIISALTIDPVKTGLKEYETKIGAIQVIKANTRSKYATEEEQMAAIEKTLSDMNDYADRTIYNYTQMTNNLGKFVNQGLDLDVAANAVMGLANLAGASGASAEDMARATYQMSQAMGGVIRKIDWNSLRNANMAGVELKNVLTDLARVEGVDIDGFLAEKGTFEETLEKGWLTGELFTKAMNIYSDAYSEAELAAMGFNDAQIKNFKALAQTAREATVEVKTASQLWDVLKETAQSGWTQTWELIIGDFDTAKKMFTGLQVYFSDIINRMSDARNRVLEIALNFTKPWTEMVSKLSKISDVVSNVTGPISSVGEVVSSIGDKFKNATEAVDYYQKIVRSVWRGNWKRSDTGRYELLEAAGYDHRVVQDLVNLGSRHKITIEDIERSHKKFGLTLTTSAEETEKVTDAVASLTDEQLKNAGLTEEEISLYRALEEEAAKAGVTFDELADEMSKVSGRDLLIESFKNMWDVVVGVSKAIKNAYVDIFNPPSLEVMGIRLYGIIRTFKEFTETIRLTDKETGKLNETGKKIERVFKGVMAVADILLTIFGTGFRIAFKIVSQVLEFFGMGLLDVAALVGDALVKFHDWFESLFDISGLLEVVVPLIQAGAKAVGEWFAAFKASDGMQNTIKYIQDIGAGIRDWWAGLKDAENLPKTIAEGIVNFFSNIPTIVSTVFSSIWSALKGSASGFDSSGIFGGFLTSIQNGLSIAGQTIAELGKLILAKFNEFLTAHGFEAISADAIAGLVNGFKNGAVNAWNAAVQMAKDLVQRVKDFLGIHSPSKVFYAIGGFMVAGLIAGLQNGIPDSLGAVKDLFQPMLDWINGIDFGAIFAGVIGVGTVATTYKAVDAVASIASAFKGVGDILENTSEVIKKLKKPIANVVNGFAKIEKAFAFKLRMEGVKTLATSLLLLVGALVVLTFIEPAKLWNAVGVIAALAAILGALAFAMDKLTSASAKLGKGCLDVKGISTGLIGIGIAILLLGMTVKTLGSLNADQAKQGFLGLAGLVAAIALVIAAFGFLVKGKAVENIDKFGKTMTKLAIAFLLMALTTKVLGGMDQATLIQGGLAIAAFAGIMVGLMAATKLISGSKNVETIGKSLLKIALAIGVMAIVAKMLGGMDRATLIQGGIAIVAFSGIIVGLMAVTKLINGTKNVDKIGGTLLKMALAIGVMAIVAKLLAGMEPAELFKGALAITAFGGIIVGLMAATKLVTGSKNIGKVGGAILGVAAAIAIMAATAFMLSMISWEGFAKGTTMVTLFAGIIVGLMAATKLVGNDADKISKTIISIAAAIGILGLIAVLLSLVPTENLVKGMLAVTALSAVMAGLIAVTKLAKNCMGNILALAGVIAVLAGSLYLISTIPVEKLLPSTIALGSLMVAAAGVLVVLSFVGKMWKDALLGALALTSIAVPLLAFVGVLYLMQNVQNAMSNVLALTVLATAMTALLIPLTLIGAAGMTGAPYLGALALLAMAVPLLAFVGVLALMSGIQNGIENAMALTTLMTAIGDVLFKISLVAPLAVIGVGAISAMINLMTAMGLFATAIGALVTKFPQLQTFLDGGIDILAQLASGLGRVIASFVTGFAGEVMTILPALGKSLSDFMTNASVFIEGAKLVDDSVLKGVGILAGAIMAFTVAELLSGIASLSGLGLADLGTQLSMFMTNALPFITGARLVTPESMEGIRALSEAILILTAANVIEGLTSFFTGGSSLENFASQLPILGAGLAAFAANIGTFSPDQLATVNCAANAIRTLAKASSEIPNAGGLLGQLVGENDLGVFANQFPVLGTGLRTFLNNVGTFSDEQVATVNCAAQAIKTLAQASQEIPNSGGWLGQIVGDNDLGPFAEQFPVLGSGLRGFLDNVGMFTDEQVKTVDCAASAIKSLAQASSEIPNSGGWIGAIVGENDLGAFADQFPKLGTGLRGFLDNVGTFTAEQVTTVDCAADAVATLASVASTIPNEGGWISKIVGDNNLGTFASNFPKLGEGLSGFVEKLGVFTGDQVSTVSSAVRAIQALTGLANADLKGATKHLGDFGDDLPGFAKDISSFCTKMPSSESTSSAVTNLNKILAAVRSIANANSGALATFADNLKKIGEDAVKKFVGAFTSSSAKTDLEDAAKTLAGKAVSGAESKATGRSSMESAGEDLGSGLVKGINSKQTAVYNAGYALGQKAVQGEKDGQQSKSPSKLTIQAGKWIGEGLVIGMGKMGGQVYKAGHTLGETATDTISNSIASISRMVSSDIDAQPTIRPVLDLSDVRSGAAALDSMLDMNSSVGVNANIGAISSMMATHSQNGANADVVDAIDKLNKRMDNLGNTTNIINGVTYDDGSNINNAVATLVRAAKIERRV